MTRIVGISGSLRQASYNTALLENAAALMPAGCRLEPHSIKGVPLYNSDEERAYGLPKAVVALKEAIVAADGLIIATPEYNHSIPGVTKNALDWLSRPPADIARVFGGRPIAILGASTGGFGTAFAQNALLPVLRALGADFWSGGWMMVSRAHEVFDASGTLVDVDLREALRRFLAGFACHVQKRMTPVPAEMLRAERKESVATI